ncbi:MAG: lyase family protein [Promethearchaeota archaeon]
MIHPIDYRYKIAALEEYLSPTGLLRYHLRVEVAYIKALSRIGVCSDSVFQEYAAAESMVKYERVAELELELKHDIKALVEALRELVSSSAKPFCHLGLTSYDTVVNSFALLIRDIINDLLLPSLRDLLAQLIRLAREHRDAVQMGRTHGQHAEPTTFGYALANYVERLGKGFLRIRDVRDTLKGKIGGAVGTRAGLDLIADSRRIETETLSILGLGPVEAPSQIANQEEVANFYSQLVLALGTITDLANDLRQLQRTEIGEVFEVITDKQVGSSTMPQKRNPIGWENIISHYKAIAPRLVTIYLNIISEHQRDLTDSAANRYLLAEILNTFLYCVNRATNLLSKLEIDTQRMKDNFSMNLTMELAEPAYILLALSGADNAHDIISELSKKARRESRPFKELLLETGTFGKRLDSFSAAEKAILEDSFRYVGRASEITDSVCNHWEKIIRG